VDYLLKPFDRLRFQEALQRVRRRLTEHSHETLSGQIEQLVKRFQQTSPYLRRLVIRTEGAILLVRVEDVDWLEAAGNYVCIHLGKRNHIVRDSLVHLEKQLDPARFLRVHRSAMVNLERIHELRPTFQGDYRVVLLSGDVLPLSRKYREALTRQLGIAL
jgi:two-component system LytT family response regulator